MSIVKVVRALMRDHRESPSNNNKLLTSNHYFIQVKVRKTLRN